MIVLLGSENFAACLPPDLVVAYVCIVVSQDGRFGRVVLSCRLALWALFTKTVPEAERVEMDVRIVC